MKRFGAPIAAAGLIAGIALACAAPALADVKAGVDAWAAGDFTRAVAEWKGPAAKGDADALFNLAQAYRLGRGVPEDLKQAETLYARAAAKGHIKAADNYGLLLFQDGRREQAMPYVTAAAERGDPRAQYLLGIAHFNGDLVPKDWVRAYALLTLANGAGLPQAGPAIKQMDEFVPLAQRQQAQTLATQMRASADAQRSSQMAAADLGDGVAAVTSMPARVAAVSPTVLPPARVPQPVASVAVPPSSIAVAEAAVAEAMRATGTESPATAGADFARPEQVASPPSRPARDVAQAQVQRADPPVKPSATTGGPWKLQLGAFSVAGNADRLWSQLAGKAALAGKSKLTAPAGRLTRLLASGWPSEAAAQTACASLKASGQSCLVTR
ncbi:SPOR domain-containing protein [Tsuneonella rigui]|uniref:SPOR domain-containing protein n=1 Tax=Tsuneonella rigui TaxID=1708790 RepID=UPI000F7EFF19|nr:SPOR domain-containing protein [Tsuneonella rigui]